MKSWLLIILFYLSIGCELIFNDEAIVIRYLHFAYLPYFVVMLLFALYLFLFQPKKILWFLPALFFISYNFLMPFLSSLAIPNKITKNDPVTTLNLLSFSVNSRNRDYQKVAQLIKENPADIICLQEIPYSRYMLFMDALKQEKLHYEHNYSKRSSSMILTKHTITPNATIPYQKATLSIANQTLRIWNIHSPKSLKKKHYQDKFMQMLTKDVSTDNISHKLICGDFNATPHNTFIRPFFNTLHPAFHATNNHLTFTYPTDKIKIPLPFPLLKIDYFFLSNTMKATHYQRLTRHANSDHYPITAKVNLYDIHKP